MSFDDVDFDELDETVNNMDLRLFITWMRHDSDEVDESSDLIVT